jgi:hypothetical protein
MKKIFNYFWNTPTGNKLLMGKVFLICTIVVYCLSYKYVTHVSIGALNQINQVDTIENKGLELTFKNLHSSRLMFLENQYKAAGQLKSSCKEVALLYFKNYYAFTVCFALFSAMLSVSLFLVAHKGWQHADDKLKTFVMLCVVFSSFFYFLPKMMNNESNMYKNIEKQRAYQGIQLDVLTFVNSGDTARADSMINHVDNAIKKDYGFMIAIDPTAVSNPLDQLNSTLGNGGTSTASSSAQPEQNQKKWPRDNNAERQVKPQSKK